jgi:hypothetical protein
MKNSLATSNDSMNMASSNIRDAGNSKYASNSRDACYNRVGRNSREASNSKMLLAGVGEQQHECPQQQGLT